MALSSQRDFDRIYSSSTFLLSMFMLGAFLRFGSIAAWIVHVIARMGGIGCLGRDARAELISIFNELLRGQNNNSCTDTKATNLIGIIRQPALVR
ncbi:hypothetical protein OROMI_004079 [Orobanche minor]